MENLRKFASNVYHVRVHLNEHAIPFSDRRNFILRPRLFHAVPPIPPCYTANYTPVPGTRTHICRATRILEKIQEKLPSTDNHENPRQRSHRLISLRVSQGESREHRGRDRAGASLPKDRRRAAGVPAIRRRPGPFSDLHQGDPADRLCDPGEAARG